MQRVDDQPDRRHVVRHQLPEVLPFDVEEQQARHRLQVVAQLQGIGESHGARDRVVAGGEAGAPFPEVLGVEEEAVGSRGRRGEGGEGEVDEELPRGLCFFFFEFFFYIF